VESGIEAGLAAAAARNAWNRRMAQRKTGAGCAGRIFDQVQ
jgi:hypothetical protein